MDSNNSPLLGFEERVRKINEVRLRYMNKRRITKKKIWKENVSSNLAEPNGLMRDDADGKNLDGMTLIPWKMWRPLVWDATCVDTMAPYHLSVTSGQSGAAASKAENLKRHKYSYLDRVNLFVPFGVEALGDASLTTRHHLIPGTVFREAFWEMWSNQSTWPYMVQMLNAALENLRYHMSSITLNSESISNAQTALNMFDERIPDCDDVDSLYKAIQDLFAVFYWSPFNIYYGPAPEERAADPLDKRDIALHCGIDTIVVDMTTQLEKDFKESKISLETVRLYVKLLISYPKPKITGYYKEISPTFHHYVGNYVKNVMKLTPNTVEYEQKISEIKRDEIYSDFGSSLCHFLKRTWNEELTDIESCDRCKTNAKDSLVNEADENYKCKDKKCPFGKTKYYFMSAVNCTSELNNLAKSEFRFYYIRKKLKKSNRILDIVIKPLQKINELVMGIDYKNSEEINPPMLMEYSHDAVLGYFGYVTKNIDVDYKRLMKTVGPMERKTSKWNYAAIANQCDILSIDYKYYTVQYLCIIFVLIIIFVFWCFIYTLYSFIME